MLGLGRFGGIAGSFLVAELAHRQLTFSQIFTIVAIPGLIAAAALMIKQLAHPEVRPTPPPERRPVVSSTAGAVPDGPRGRPRMRWPMLE